MDENISGIRFPEYVRRIISKLSDEGFDSYAVGGCVRDSFLGRIPHDWDITTAARPDDVIRIFSEGEIHVIGTAGIRHGTVMVKSGSDVCEVTTFRSDGDYNDHRRPDSVSFSDTVEEDLARRDFTMNAIAVKPTPDGACVVDPFGGADDIKAGVIRTVGDPAARFTEDALRIMRAVRFSAELDFYVDKDTARAAIDLKDTLEYVSAERITAELWRTLCAGGAEKAVTAFREIFEWLTPMGLSQRFLKYVGVTDNPYVRLALMLEHGHDPSEFFGKMRFSGKARSLVSSLLSIKDMPNSRMDVCRLLRAYGEDVPVLLEYYRILELDGSTCSGMSYNSLSTEIDAIITEKVPYALHMLDFRGGDAISAGVPQKSIGDALEFLLAEVQAGYVPNKKEALADFLMSKYKTE